MSYNPDPTIDSSQPVVYQIRLKGHLGSQWTDWFGGLTITLEEDGNTFLSGPVAEQAAPHGLLKKVRDLGIPLVSVCPVEPRPLITLPLQVAQQPKPSSVIPIASSISSFNSKQEYRRG